MYEAVGETFMDVQQNLQQLNKNISKLTVILESDFDAPAKYSACPKVPALYKQFECLSS